MKGNKCVNKKVTKFVWKNYKVKETQIFFPKHIHASWNNSYLVIHLSYKLSDTTEETTIESCDKSEVIYDKSVVTSSLVEDFEMICSESYQRDIINSIYMLGSAFGSGNYAFPIKLWNSFKVWL